MDSDALSIGSSGALIANLLLFAVMENVSEPSYWSSIGAYAPHPSVRGDTTKLIETWRPFVDDPGWGGSRRKSCPEPRSTRAGGAVPQAPLPSGYDPYAPLEQPFHACLLVAGDGRILKTKLIGSSGSARTDGRILALIATRWRMGAPGEGRGPEWLRVRLNAGPDEGEIREPYLAY
ncbi:MAG TPA: hypothetical protein VIA98_12040 [Allosphingosinicella sp.]|jgi:hypothetical protein